MLVSKRTRRIVVSLAVVCSLILAVKFGAAGMAYTASFDLGQSFAPRVDAPAISENSASTYISLPAIAPFANTAFLSGVISDPTDPGAVQGVDFTVGDPETASEALTLAASSSDTAVVPNDPANLIFSGAGASRKLRIVPTGVGYSTITITVTDGEALTANYVLNYAASAASASPSTTRFHTQVADASTAVAISSGFMFVADDEDQVIRLYDRNNSGLPVASTNFMPSNAVGALPLQLTQRDNGIPREVDIEASVRIGNRIFWLASHSNAANGNQRPNRSRLFATDVGGSGGQSTLTYVGRYDGLKADLIQWDLVGLHGLGADRYGFDASTRTGVFPEQPDGSGFNIEGLVMAPGSVTTGYVSFRAPISPSMARTKALIVPVTNLDQLVLANPTAGPATFGDPIEMDLGGRGIRSISKNAADEYLIVAGPTASAGDFALYTWDGNPATAPVRRLADLTGMNPECIVDVPASLTAASQIQLVSDGGDDILYGDGVTAKTLPQSNFKKFRSHLVTLGGPVNPTSTISGTVAYGNTPVGQPAKFVPGVVLTAVGSVPVNATTDGLGAYVLSGIGAGAYTVTPTKSSSGDGISALDASRVAQHAAGLIVLTSNQILAGDATNNGTLSALDASRIAQFAAGIPNLGIAGQWKFVPTSKTYVGVPSSIINENYQAILVGDVTGNWTPPAVPGTIEDTERGVSETTQSSFIDRQIWNRDGQKFDDPPFVDIPSDVTPRAGSVMKVPIRIGDAGGKGVVAYEFTLDFDPKLLSPIVEATGTAGTLSEGWSVTVNSEVPGRIRVVAYGTQELVGAGTLLNLNFAVMGSGNATTPLKWTGFRFNEDEVLSGPLDSDLLIR